MLLSACSEEETSNNENIGNNVNKAAPNNGNNGTTPKAWTLSIDGQEPMNGFLIGRIQLTTDKLMLQFNSISLQAQGQFTVYGITAGETGTYEEIDITMTAFPGAERCSYASQVSPFPISLTITENSETAFDATFTITDLGCKTPTGDPASDTNGTGTFNMVEESLYTVEAFTDFIRALKPDGVFAVIRFLNSDVRYSTVAAEALVRNGITDPENHIATFRQGSMAGVLVSKSKFTNQSGITCGLKVKSKSH